MPEEYEEIRITSEAGYVHRFDEETTRVLGGFGLRFDNHDHPIGWISAGGVTYGRDGFDPHSFLLALSDADNTGPIGSRDPCTMWAKLFRLPPRAIRVASGSGDRTGSGAAPVSVGADEHFLLRGFSFSLTRNTNHNLRRIAIRFDRERGQVEAILRDNSPSDDGFHFEVVYTTMAMGSAFHAGPFAADFTFTQATTVPLRERGQAILTGFDFEFTDTDHHLREISIDPQTRDHFLVRFTDDERDNPVRAHLDYLVYAPFVY